jgi:hypothetical protein
MNVLANRSGGVGVTIVVRCTLVLGIFIHSQHRVFVVAMAQRIFFKIQQSKQTFLLARFKQEQ